MELPVFCFHELDRYALLQELIAYQRKKIGIDQRTLASNLKLSQAVISAMENLVLGVENPKKRVSRENFLKVLVDGLQLNQKVVACFSWLFDGTIPTPQELSTDTTDKANIQSWFSKSPQELYALLRRETLSLLQELCPTQAEERIVTVGMAYTTAEQDRLYGERILHALEKKPGRILAVKQYPSALHLIDEFPKKIIAFINDPKLETILQGLRYERLDLFVDTIKNYGEKCIYSKKHFQRYLSQNHTSSCSFKQRIKIVKNMIKLLTEHPQYEIAFAPSTTYLEVAIKGASNAIMRETSETIDVQDDLVWEPHYIHFYDTASVIELLTRFELRWDRLMAKAEEEQDKNLIEKTAILGKELVIAWLEKQIEPFEGQFMD